MNSHRRSFILNSGRAAVLVCAASAVQACGGLPRMDFARGAGPAVHGDGNPAGGGAAEEAGRQDAASLEQVLGTDGMRILELASLAPSGHNTQPWRVLVHAPHAWEVTLDPDRLLPVVDASRRETWLSVGAFLENLRQAARQRGYDAAFAVNGTLADGSVTVRLTPGAPSGANTGTLRRRRTVRSDLDGTPLRRETLADLLNGLPGVRYVAKDSDEGRAIADATEKAAVQQNGDDEAMRELSDWIRWSNSDAETHRDGLTPATMDITGVAALFVRWCFDRETVMKDSFRSKAVDIVREQLARHGGWLLLSADGDSLRDVVEAGRRFEQLALRCCAMNIALHPMSQALEEAPWSATLRERLQAPRLQFVLRTGYLDAYPEPVSLRRPVHAFTRAA